MGKFISQFSVESAWHNPPDLRVEMGGVVPKLGVREGTEQGARILVFWF